MLMSFLKKIKYFFLNLKPRIIGYKNIIISKKEVFNLKKSNKKICLIYDLKTNPVSIGNYALVIFFARYLSLKGYKIYISIVQTKNYKQSKREIKSKRYIFKFFEQLPKILIKKNLKQIKFLDWDEIENNIEKHRLHVLLKEICYKRILPMAAFINSIINIFTLGDEGKFFKKFLIDENTFIKFSNKKIENFKKKKYISILFRYDKFNPSRNTQKREIIEILNSINLKFPKVKLLIISDNEGCLKAKEFLKNKKNIFYSKDLSSSIFSDIFLQLKSALCVACHNSGGMLTWPYFSKNKFCFTNYMGLHARLKYNHYYKTNKIHPWWNNNQVFKTSMNHKILINLINNYKDKI